MCPQPRRENKQVLPEEPAVVGRGGLGRGMRGPGIEQAAPKSYRQHSGGVGLLHPAWPGADWWMLFIDTAESW